MGAVLISDLNHNRFSSFFGGILRNLCRWTIYTQPFASDINAFVFGLNPIRISVGLR